MTTALSLRGLANAHGWLSAIKGPCLKHTSKSHAPYHPTLLRLSSYPKTEISAGGGGAVQ